MSNSSFSIIAYTETYLTSSITLLLSCGQSFITMTTKSSTFNNQYLSSYTFITTGKDTG
jgi:hypothetical protein